MRKLLRHYSTIRVSIPNMNMMSSHLNSNQRRQFIYYFFPPILRRTEMQSYTIDSTMMPSSTMSTSSSEIGIGLNDATTTSATLDTDPDYQCMYNGRKLSPEDRIEIDCDTICKCMGESGKVECEPRCPKMNHTTSEQCVTVPDPKDSCCQIELCDVTLDDHEQSSGAIVVVPPPPSMIEKTSKDNSTSVDQKHCVHENRTYKRGKYLVKMNL